MLYWKSYANDLPIFLDMLLIVFHSFTNRLPMFYWCNFNVIIIAKCLPVIWQSASSYYSIMLYQSFTNHYQSDPVLYKTSLPMITSKFLIHHCQSLATFCQSYIYQSIPSINLPITANGYPLTVIGNDIHVWHELNLYEHWLVILGG